MSVKLKDFKTDFTEFLHSNIPHTVKVVTDNKILECSSILLSQHSSTLKDMISKDNEIFMLDYQFVEDLLVLLYGGSVELSLENCSEFIKFSCQFGISGVVEQVFNFLSSVVDESNLVSVVRVCIGGIKAAKFFEFKPYDSEVFFTGELVLSKMSREEVQTFANNFQAEEVFTMFANRVFVKRILPVSGCFITQDNVEIVLNDLFALEDFVDSASLCLMEELTDFFSAFEELSLNDRNCKELLQLKKFVYKQVSLDDVMTDITNSRTDSSLFQKSLKNWKTFSIEKLILLCKYGSNCFYLIEIVLSWIDLKRPTISTVKRLFSLIDLTKVSSHYLEHVEKVIKNIGYCVSLESDCKGMSTSEQSHRINLVEIKYENDVPTVAVTVTVPNVPNVFGSINRNKCKSNYSSYTQLKITVGIQNGINVTCENCTECDWSRKFVYGTCSDGRRIPIYSDPVAACKMLGSNKPKLALFHHA